MSLRADLKIVGLPQSKRARYTRSEYAVPLVSSLNLLLVTFVISLWHFAKPSVIEISICPSSILEIYVNSPSADVLQISGDCLRFGKYFIGSRTYHQVLSAWIIC